MNAEFLFSRSMPIAERIDELLAEATRSIDCALYRLGHPRLSRSLAAAAERGVRVRLVLDRSKFREGIAAQLVAQEKSVACRLSSGRSGPRTKMHHKFAVLDGKAAMTGSYNWTVESERENYENLVILHDAAVAESYANEFESLWAESTADAAEK
jgi:phosphatidylserine/phosphatidylglycerophosphate/cardiolipin synthase-like enzyme